MGVKKSLTDLLIGKKSPLRTIDAIEIVLIPLKTGDFKAFQSFHIGDSFSLRAPLAPYGFPNFTFQCSFRSCFHRQISPHWVFLSLWFQPLFPVCFSYGLTFIGDKRPEKPKDGANS